MTPSMLLPLAVASYGVVLGLVLLPRVRPGLARVVLGLGLSLHFSWFVWRGLAIGFMPLTNKTESFSAAAFAMALVLAAGWRDTRSFLVPQLVLLLASGVAASLFPQALSEPGPMLRTWWYPAHVPLSFVGLATWTAAGTAVTALVWIV